MNHFNLMLQKRLKNEEEEELDEEDKGKGKKGSKNRKSKGWKIQIFFCYNGHLTLFIWFILIELKISEMDEWVESEEDESGQEEEVDEEKEEKKKKQKRNISN